MRWKKVIEDSELIVFEKKLDDMKVRIEARFVENSWKIFKTYIHENVSSLISEYSLDNISQVRKKIDDLKKEKILNSNEIKNINPLKKEVAVKLRRVFKEEFIEKWDLSIFDKKEKNFLFVRYDDDIEIDFVIDEKYKPYQQEINLQIEDKLGFREFSDYITYNIYYFKDHKSEKKPVKTVQQDTSVVYGRIDIEFNFDDEYS